MNLYQNLTLTKVFNVTGDGVEPSSHVCIAAVTLALPITPPGHLPVFPSSHPLLRSQVFVLVGLAINCDAVATGTGLEPACPTFAVLGVPFPPPGQPEPPRLPLFNHPC